MMKPRALEPRGLYQQDKDPNTQAAERRKIQQHNWDVLMKAGKKLKDIPLLFSDTARPPTIPLPDLWCNSSNPKDASRDRFFLIFLAEEPERDGSVVLKLSIVDNHRVQIAAIRDWRFELEGTAKSKAVHITSTLDTTIGYEGNGYGRALLALTETALPLAIDAILNDNRFVLNRVGRTLPWYAQIGDSAKATSQLNPTQSADRDDVPTNRKQWTSQGVRDLLPDYVQDVDYIAQHIGFRPGAASGTQFYKIYR